MTPEQAKALAMPGEQRIRLDDHQCLSPGPETTCQYDEDRAVAWSEDRTLGLTLQHDQLLTQKSVFGNQLGLAARDVCQGPEHLIRLSRSEAVFGGSFKSRDNSVEHKAGVFV